MSLAQQFRGPRTQQDEPAIEDGVPTPPIELEQLLCKSPHIARGKERVGSRQPSAPKPTGRKTLAPRPAPEVLAPPPAVTNAPGEVDGSRNAVPPQTAPTTPQRVEQDVQREAQENAWKHAQQQSAEVSVAPLQEICRAPALVPKSTVEVQPARGNLLTRLLGIGTTSLFGLKVTEVEEFEDEEAEMRYEKFTDFLRTASNDLSSPDDDPLVYFRGRWIEHDQVLLQPADDPNASPLPYVRFVGARDENEVMILHASLSKRKFRNEYFPPLRICYVMQPINALASKGDGFELVNANPTTLCGSLIAVGTEGNRRIVTVGGMVESVDGYYALTTSHESGPASSSSDQSYLSPLDINEEDYDEDDIDSPLVIDAGRRAERPADAPPGDNDDDGTGTTQSPVARPLIGHVRATGSDWALLEMHDRQSCLPNVTTLNIHSGHQDGRSVTEQIYLSEVASDAQSMFLQVIAGRSGTSTVRLLRKPANMRHPSGAWLNTWKAKLGPISDSRLKQGDSGSWAVDVPSGTVYGHIMAATDEYAYIQPLADIFRDILRKSHIPLKMASPFGQLAELSKAHFQSGNLALADESARKALQSNVLSRSSEVPLVSAILHNIQTWHLADIDLVIQVIMRTGRHIGLGLPRLWDEAESGGLGDRERVLALLLDLSQVAGIEVPARFDKGKQLQGFDASQGRESPEEDWSKEHQEKYRLSVSSDDDAEKGEKLWLSEKQADSAADYEEKKKKSNVPLARTSQSHKAGPSRAYTRGFQRAVVEAYDWIYKSFWAVEMDVTMVGLQNSGKTSLLRVLAGGEFTIDSLPTVGFNMKRVQRGPLTLKVWDLGGQPRFRTMWERYCRGVNAIVFVVNRYDRDTIPIAREELHLLMANESLRGIPLLVLGTEGDRDYPDFNAPAGSPLTVDEVIDEMGLKLLGQREVSCYAVSAREETNLDAVVAWLMKFK